MPDDKIYKVNLNNEPWVSTSSVGVLGDVEDDMQEKIARNLGEGENTSETSEMPIEKGEILPFSAESPEQLKEIMDYGEKMKAEGEKKKKEFWKGHDRDDFLLLLNYMLEHQKILKHQIDTNGTYKYLDKMKNDDRERFVKEYLYNDILYSGEIDKGAICIKKYGYEDWKKGNIMVEEGIMLGVHNRGSDAVKQIAENLELRDGMEISFSYNSIGDDCVESIAKMKLEEGMILDLSRNDIGPKGAEAISKMELKEGVNLGLGYNQIGDEGAEALSKIKLKSGVWLLLDHNRIGDKGAKAIADNLKLKAGTRLYLSSNQIGAEGAEAISKMKMEKGVKIDLDGNHIGAEGAKAISKMKLEDNVYLMLWGNQIGTEGAKAIAENLELKEGVVLSLNFNEFGDEGAKAISKMKLKKGVKLLLDQNQIGNEGAKAISKNLKLKEGVFLDLSKNEIGDEGAQALMDNMELEDGMVIDLTINRITLRMKNKLKEWEHFYLDKGINCRIIL